MSTSQLNFTPELYQYIQKNSLKEPVILQELRAETAKLPAGQMQIAPEQGQFLALLVELMGAKKTLEVGVFTGYSSLVVALALPADGRIIACDIDARSAAMAQTFWQRAGVANKIELKIAPALTTLDELITHEAATFDFAFIDADKANYIQYYERCLKLLRPGGLLVVDNTLWHGRVADSTDREKITQMIRAFNQHVYQDERVSLSLIPLGDGLTLLRKK